MVVEKKLEPPKDVEVESPARVVEKLAQEADIAKLDELLGEVRK
jgi:acetyltransferase-like isoleucine patch superfamily enzyme